MKNRDTMEMLTVLIVLMSLICPGVPQFQSEPQYFIEEPRSQQVIQGRSVTLNCVIGNRKGDVQWTKDMFPLGYNHTIPGHSRYSIQSTHSNEVNLRIINTEMVDDAIFECQVLPFDGDPPLRATATLTILVPCEPPKILNYNNGSTVEIRHTNKSFSLSCEAKRGRPAADITWYRNGRRVTDNIVYTVEPIQGDKRETARSVLTLLLGNHEEENGAVYRCEAYNSAVLGGAMSTSVRLSILFPPEQPIISGYTNGTALSINTQLMLTCVAFGGNPIATVSWYRNNQAVDWTTYSNSSSAINTYNLSVSAADNDAIYQCRVTNLATNEPLVKQYKLTVNFPPSHVQMMDVPASVRAGDQLDLTCVSSNSNPQANITWFFRNAYIARNFINETYRSSPFGGYITTSRVTISVRETDHNSLVSCRARAAGDTVTDNNTLNVLYPPSNLTISNYNEGSSIRAGEVRRLRCVAIGGNPPAQVKWYKGNRELTTSVNYEVVGNTAQAELALLASPSDNGARYACKALNTTLVQRRTLTVHFPPQRVTISVNPAQPTVNEEVSLQCVSSSSNPAAQIVWLRNGYRMTGVSLGTESSDHGGKTTSNRLRFTPTSRDHHSVFSCQATNSLLDQSVTDAVTLSVLFKPEFNEATLPARINVKQGESASINLTAYANPPRVTYTLQRLPPSSPLPSRFRLTQGLLNISTLEKSDSGNYTVSGENNQGASSFNFSINVKYPAQITYINSTISLNEGDLAKIVCTVDANPLIPNIVTWSREGFDMSRTYTKSQGPSTSLFIPDVTRTDTGTFTCVADNRVGAPVTQDVKLVVKFPPEIDKSPEVSRAAGETGATVTMRCKARGAPGVTFHWTRNNIAIASSDKYALSGPRQKDEATYISTLKVKNLNRQDYGSYVCTATNSKGSDSNSIELSGTSKPWPPLNITADNTTSSSITLSWKANFDGGLPQSFRVRYKPTDALGFEFKDVLPYGATTFTISGLQLGTEYEFAVKAINERGESLFITGLTKRTRATMDMSLGTLAMDGADEVPVIIILVVCIVGVFILALNVGLILFFIQRRKKRTEGNSDTTSHTNTFELYGNTKVDSCVGRPGSEDQNSYGTYDKSMDDFSDDYIRDYEPGETHMFLPSQPDYPGSRPYSPHKGDSPGSPRRGQKVMYGGQDDGRLSPWSEDPYKVALPRKKGAYENGVPNGDIYEFGNRGKPPHDFHSDSRPPSSRSGKTPPPPPSRSSSRGGDPSFLPPVPTRHYDPHETSTSSSAKLSYRDDDRYGDHHETSLKSGFSDDDRCNGGNHARNHKPGSRLSPRVYDSSNGSSSPTPRYTPMPGRSQRKRRRKSSN